MKKVLFFALFLIISLGCTKQTPKPSKPTSSVETRKVHGFSALVVDGLFNLKLKNSKHYRLVLKGRSDDLKTVTTKVKDNTLYIKRLAGTNLPIDATLYSPKLTSITFNSEGQLHAPHYKTALLNLYSDEGGTIYLNGKVGLKHLNIHGNAHVNIRGVSSNNLTINMEEKPHVSLTGIANLRHLDFSGDGFLNAYWLDSTELDIKGSGKAQVKLAGIARILNIELHDAAQIDARYLRARNAYVKTFDESIARVAVTRSQNTLASDHSTIYYYNEPSFQATHMAENGAVLDMNQNK